MVCGNLLFFLHFLLFDHLLLVLLAGSVSGWSYWCGVAKLNYTKHHKTTHCPALTLGSFLDLFTVWNFITVSYTYCPTAKILKIKRISGLICTRVALVFWDYKVALLAWQRDQSKADDSQDRAWLFWPSVQWWMGHYTCQELTISSTAWGLLQELKEPCCFLLSSHVAIETVSDHLFSLNCNLNQFPCYLRFTEIQICNEKQSMRRKPWWCNYTTIHFLYTTIQFNNPKGCSVWTDLELESWDEHTADCQLYSHFLSTMTFIFISPSNIYNIIFQWLISEL